MRLQLVTSRSFEENRAVVEGGRAPSRVAIWTTGPTKAARDAVNMSAWRTRMP